MLKAGDVILDDAGSIAQHVLGYFSNLYVVPNDCQVNDLINKVVPNSISAEVNSFLTRLPSNEEIRNVVFAMNSEEAPGSNGFGGCFFQSFWNIISVDVCNAVSQFFAQNWLLPNMNSNLVVLIPKMPNADRIEDFRPIALANFQFKIINKVLADRLSGIAARIISTQ